jgi:Gpi18-like mannosyltransferase
MISFIKKHGIATFILIGTFCLLSYFSYYNEYEEGGGDNSFHYFFSKYAFAYPKFFLDHWAKPLFTLLSSPFSQFGIYGTKIFNILVGITAAIFTYHFAIAMKFKYSWVVIILALYLPANFFIMQSAMTEPLMSLAIIASFYFFYREKYVAGAIVMSFSLFCRSEGMFLALYALMYLALIRKWKYIPFLSTGFFIYAFIGLFSGRNFFWYFTENPYSAISQYGHGEWNHFFKSYEFMWGLPQTIALCSGLILVITLSVIKIKKINLSNLIPEHKFLLLVVNPAILFFAFHVIVWRFGWCASFGLERVLNSIAPLIALIAMFALNYLISEKLPKLIALPLIFIFLFFSLRATFKFISYPLRSYGDSKLLFEAAQWFKKNCNPNSKIYFSHPSLMLYLDRNLYDKSKNLELSGIDPSYVPDKSVPIYLFWDSQFSEFANGVKLDKLQNSKDLKLVLHPQENYGFNLYVFEVIR